MAQTRYIWDLDKTYLKTEFDSFAGLLRTAFESPEKKENFPGTASLIRELKKRENSEIYFISGSPRQMRNALEKKLSLDGAKWDGFVLKENLENFLKGRFRALREQVGYKLPALLKLRKNSKPGTSEIMFGDDAESDAFIYSIYADILGGRVPVPDLRWVLGKARVYEDTADEIEDLAALAAKDDPVRIIFINLDRKTPTESFTRFGTRVVPIHNYFQAGMVLHARGYLSGRGLVNTASEMIDRYAYSTDNLSNSFQDLLRRGVVGRAEAMEILEKFESIPALAGLTNPFRKKLAVMRVERPAGGRSFIPSSDYPDLYGAWMETEKKKSQLYPVRRFLEW